MGAGCIIKDVYRRALRLVRSTGDGGADRGSCLRRSTCASFRERRRTELRRARDEKGSAGCASGKKRGCQCRRAASPSRARPAIAPATPNAESGDFAVVGTAVVAFVVGAEVGSRVSVAWRSIVWPFAG